MNDRTLIRRLKDLQWTFAGMTLGAITFILDQWPRTIGLAIYTLVAASYCLGRGSREA